MITNDYYTYILWEFTDFPQKKNTKSKKKNEHDNPP